MARNERVVVVGAGPVGMVAALALAKQGLRVTVLEADAEDRARPASRAIGLFIPSLKRLESVEPGLGRAVAEHLASPAGLREWLTPVVGDWHANHLQWVSTYRFHQAVAGSFTDQHHRVLLAGEAAHLFAPWGGRGLNSGVIDATDAATAIGNAINDPADATRHIQRCAADRRKWAVHNRDLSSRALRQMRADDPMMRFTRDLAARVSPAFVPAGAWLASAPIKPFVPWPWAKSHY